MEVVGGFGCFFKVQNGKEIKAFKVTKKAVDPKSIQEIKQEMDKKSHPNVLRLYDVVVLPAKNLLIVLEYIEGFSLQEYVEKKIQNITPLWGKYEFLLIFKNILEGVQYLHNTLQRYHIDLKPGNVMWDLTNKQAVIIDIIETNKVQRHH